jgi:hypothetical protein
MTEQEAYDTFMATCSDFVVPHLRQLSEANVWSMLLGLMVKDSLDRGTQPKEIARRLNSIAIALIETGAVVVEIQDPPAPR